MFGFYIIKKENNMNLITNYQAPVNATKPVVQQQEPVKPKDEYKPDFLDKLSNHVVSRRDLTDNVTVPRSIFKGYLCFTAGSALSSISCMLKQGKATKGLGVAGALLSIYGTYNFVKSFLVKDK